MHQAISRGESRGTTAADEVGDPVPVDIVGKGIGEDLRQAKALQLFSRPLVHHEIFVQTFSEIGLGVGAHFSGSNLGFGLGGSAQGSE